MKTLIFQTIFSCRASSSNVSTLSYHCFLFHSNSTRESQKRRDQISQHSSSTSSSKHQDEQSRNVKVSVWWDFENCSVPSDTNVFRVTQRITSALRANWIKGPITITAFGDVIRLWRSNQEALYSTGVCLKHIPFGGKNCADSLLVDLVYWVSQNPPPAHLFLISGDRDFANVLHRLRMSNYNILLSSTDPAPGVLCNAASIVWQWNSLVRGEDLTGKHFNQPPDGPFGSWYGYHKGPLEDPFTDLEQQTCLGPQESPEAGIESTIRPLPQALLSRIHQILNSNPEGIAIETLRAELLKNNLTMDRDFFGYKKFSRLLLSISTVSKLQPVSDGQLLVHGIHPNSAEPVESKSKMYMGLEINDADIDQAAAVDQKGGHGTEFSDMEGKASSVVATVSPIFEGLPPACQAENNVITNINNPTSVEKQGLTSELGIFSGICSTWCGLKDSWNKKGENVPQKSSTSDCSKKTKSVESLISSTSASYCSPSSIVTILAQDENATKDSGVGGEKSGPGAGLFNKVLDWCGLWRTSGNPDEDERGKCSEELEKRKELFSQDSF